MTTLFPRGWTRRVSVEALVSLTSPRTPTALASGCGCGCSRPNSFRAPLQLTFCRNLAYLPSSLIALPSVTGLLHSCIYGLSFLVFCMLTVVTQDVWSCWLCVHWSENSLRPKSLWSASLSLLVSRCCLVHRVCVVTFPSPCHHLSTLFSRDIARSQKGHG